MTGTSESLALRLCPHEAGLDPLAHHETAQRRNEIERRHPQATREVDGEEIGKQGAIHQVHRGFARSDIGAPGMSIALEHLGAADVSAFTQRLTDMGGEESRIAQTEIEPLRPDRRKGMRCLADESEARRDDTSDMELRERYRRAGTGDPHLAKHRMHPALEGEREARIVQTPHVFGGAALHHPDEARGMAEAWMGRIRPRTLGVRCEGHERARAAARMELGRAIPMGQLMAQDRDKRRLRQALEARRNAGGLTQLRALAVRRDDQRGFEAFIADRDAGDPALSGSPKRASLASPSMRRIAFVPETCRRSALDSSSAWIFQPKA